MQKTRKNQTIRRTFNDYERHVILLPQSRKHITALP